MCLPKFLYCMLLSFSSPLLITAIFVRTRFINISFRVYNLYFVWNCTFHLYFENIFLWDWSKLSVIISYFIVRFLNYNILENRICLTTTHGLIWRKLLITNYMSGWTGEKMKFVNLLSFPLICIKTSFHFSRFSKLEMFRLK